MERYYRQYTYAVDLLFQRIDEFRDKDYFCNREIIVFGVSKITKIMIAYIRKIGYEVSCIIDNSAAKETKPIMNIKVVKPDEILGDFKENALVLIISAHQDAMIKQLEAMGYEYEKHIIQVLDLLKVCEDFSYVDRTGYMELDGDEIRAKQIGILKHFKRVCEENDIWYSLAYGTLLGAVRHKGYIPWDDDIDLYLMVDDIEKFEKAFENETYQLLYSKNCPGSFVHLGFLADTSTVLDYNKFIPQFTSGVAVDVFFLYAQPEEEDFAEYINKINELEKDAFAAYHDKEQCRIASEKLADYLESYRLSDCDFMGNALSPYYQRDRFPKSILLERDMLLFEDEMYYVMKDYKEYLTIVYGDYMKLPPQNQRGRRHYYKAYERQTRQST